MIDIDEVIEILLVEDSHSDALFTQLALTEFNPALTVVWVENGDEAMDFLFCRGDFEDREIDRPPNLILLDLKLPGEDGKTILKNLKSHFLTRSIPVIVFTSSDLKEDREACMELGAVYYLVKSLNFKEYTDSIIEIGHQWLV